MGRRKSHSLRENNDPYAEGWDARSKNEPRDSNPYVATSGVGGRWSERRQDVQNHDVELWFCGWDEYEVDED